MDALDPFGITAYGWDCARGVYCVESCDTPAKVEVPDTRTTTAARLQDARVQGILAGVGRCGDFRRHPETPGAEGYMYRSLTARDLQGKLGPWTSSDSFGFTLRWHVRYEFSGNLAWAWHASSAEEIDATTDEFEHWLHRHEHEHASEAPASRFPRWLTNLNLNLNLNRSSPRPHTP